MEASTVAEQLLFTTVRVETEGTAGPGVGTAFMLTNKSGESEYPFLVTNKHVVRGAHTGRLTFVQGKDDKPLLGAGYTLEITDFEKGWFGHPDPEIDITVTPMVPLARRIAEDEVMLFTRHIGMDLIPSEVRRPRRGRFHWISCGNLGLNELLAYHPPWNDSNTSLRRFPGEEAVLDRCIRISWLKRESRIPL
ncbi:MAG: hypothetical protein E6K65_16445 [Nitrospirae bacterium]|nr:MAG: hypothetical protein E6K65_16445 [Nitrospirota bacterium]